MAEIKASEGLRAIIVTPTGRDAKLICEMLQRANIVCDPRGSLREACGLIGEGTGVALVAEEALDEQSAHQLTEVLRQQPPWSDFPVILLTSRGEVSAGSQRKRALREPLGNVLLLERPVRPETLISTVEGALRGRRRQYEMRDRMEQFQRAQETLRQSEKLVVAGRLAASIAHEINNPLEAITNLLYLLRNSKSDDRGLYLNMAEQELSRVTEITKQTLRFYREPTQPGPLQVIEVMDSVLRLYHSRIERAGIVLRKELHSTWPILAASGEVRQVFSNLIINATDAMPRGGRLIVRARNAHDPATERPGVRVSVADTGTGIPPEMMGKIFEPFVTTKGDTGTGLGLWVTAEIVDKLSGRISVKSQSRQEDEMHGGTVFSIFWPAIHEVAAAAA